MKQSLFEKNLYKNLHPYLTPPKTKKEKKAYGARMRAALTDTPVPPEYQIKDPKFTPLENFLMDITFNYFEIPETNYRLTMIAVLIKQYHIQPSWKKSGITKIRYLRYHYENFLNEVYLFQERVLLLLRVIEKKCQKNQLSIESEKIRKVSGAFTKSLENICVVRGKHVHLRRYKNNKIEQIEELELFSENKYLDLLQRIEYRKLRTELSNQIILTRDQLNKVLDQVLDEIDKITFKTLVKIYKDRSVNIKIINKLIPDKINLTI